MKRTGALVTLALLILVLSLFFISCGKEAEKKAGGETAARETATTGAVEAAEAEGKAGGTVLLVVCQSGFQEKEYQPVRTALEDAGFTVKVASPQAGVAEGVSGTKVVPDLTLSEARASDYLAVVFIGGPGTESLYDLPEAHRLASDAAAQGKTLAAICLAPAVLARAGLLRGKRATVYSSASGELTAGGAVYTGASVEVDGKIVTANGPEAAAAFARAVLQSLH